jgi:hypothetical protein
MNAPQATIAAILARYNRRYERPHAVVEAEQAMLAELRLLGLTVEGPERLPSPPYYTRYRIGGLLVEGFVHIPDTFIKLRLID